MNSIVPIGAGLIISVAGYLVNRRSLKNWLDTRRIDIAKERDPLACGVCGAPMQIKKRFTGQHAGKEMLVCSRYPECRKVEWE